MISIEGHLFDLQNREDVMLLWIREDTGRVHLIYDRFQPSIYVHGDAAVIERLTRRLQVLGVLACSPGRTERIHFYTGRVVPVVCYTFAKPSFLRTIHRKLYAFFERVEIYHSDIDLPALYLFHRRWIPMARLRLKCEWNEQEHRFDLVDGSMLDDAAAMDYPAVSLRVAYLSLAACHRFGLRGNALLLESQTEQIEVPADDPVRMIHRCNDFFERNDPDVILSEYGDRTIFPALFRYAKELKIPLHADRITDLSVNRRIITEGRSYLTYGSMIFRAPSYPLYGRWHIDRHNSFVHRESGLEGVIQLSRLSCIPVQTMARSSTGTAMTMIQTAVALKQNYLVPWQKSHSEEPRSALDLLTSDKGGLVYEPDIRETNVRENVIQIDFSQMYPTIMVRHNLSPETVLCSCCAPSYADCDRVPEVHFPVCRRRRGIVPLSLAPILELRRYLKHQKKHAPTQEERFRAHQRQDALKWLLVTCFGYLGYRNAKFGRLESHEAVTAFGRQKLLRAIRICEERGYSVLHAITDCLFLQKKPAIDHRFSQARNLSTDPSRHGSSDYREDHLQACPEVHSAAGSVVEGQELQELCDAITAATSVEMSLEGVYSWIVFLSSRQDERLPVANRYFGRFTDGTMKVRGIQLRRRDTPHFIRMVQQQMLDVMSTAESVADLRALHPVMDEIYKGWRDRLYNREIPWRDLLLRRTVSRPPDEYTVYGASYLSLEQLAGLGIELQPGEKVRYLILSKKAVDRRHRYLTEEKAELAEQEGRTPVYDIYAYGKLLLDTFQELWEHFAPVGYFEELRDGQLRLFLHRRRD
jgi:DNA polymerase-2